MVWGEFEQVLARLRAHLYASSPDEPLMDALRRAVVASSSYPAGDLPELRIRMTLITSVPALQAHSMLRYAEWRDVVAEFVAEGLGDEPSGLAPQAIAHTALGSPWPCSFAGCAAGRATWRRTWSGASSSSARASPAPASGGSPTRGGPRAARRT